jgi:DNA-binding transcriptional regulator LsrR (DeoR family)
MSKLRRLTQTAYSDDPTLRLRAAWLYHAYGLTQNEVADQLGLGRSTVIRLLDEAKERGEVRVWIEEGEPQLIDLAIRLERSLALDEAIVVPSAGSLDQISRAVGLALGRFLSETIADDMAVGVGWGRTLSASLASFHPPRRSGVKVMSLLGGAVESQFANPVEFSWRLANALDAECFLFPAPLIVDSPETRRRLIENCGLGRLFEIAASLDLAVVSAGDMHKASGSLAREMIRPEELSELLALGCVADVMCTFLDGAGCPVDHAINQRTMSVGLDSLRKAKHLVIAGGGAGRAKALLAAIRGIGCNTLVTDEAAAKALLELPKD